jgi:hypothetical protein
MMALVTLLHHQTIHINQSIRQRPILHLRRIRIRLLRMALHTVFQRQCQQEEQMDSLSPAWSAGW